MKKISLFPLLCIIWMKKKLFASTSHVKKFMMAKYHYFFICGGGGAGRRRGGKVQPFNLIQSREYGIQIMID